MNTNRAFAPLVSFPRCGRNQWYERALWAAHSGTDRRDPTELATKWDKMLGMATLLAVTGVGWTAVGVAASYLLK